MAQVEACDISEDRVHLGSGVSVPSAWHVRVAGEQDVPGTITVRVEWDPALGRTVIASAAVERAEGGVEITSQMLREVRTHWILASSAFDVVTVQVDGGRTVGAREFLGEQLAHRMHRCGRDGRRGRGLSRCERPELPTAQARVGHPPDQSEHRDTTHESRA